VGATSLAVTGGGVVGASAVSFVPVDRLSEREQQGAAIAIGITAGVAALVAAYAMDKKSTLAEQWVRECTP